MCALYLHCYVVNLLYSSIHTQLETYPYSQFQISNQGDKRVEVVGPVVNYSPASWDNISVLASCCNKLTPI